MQSYTEADFTHQLNILHQAISLIELEQQAYQVIYSIETRREEDEAQFFTESITEHLRRAYTPCSPFLEEIQQDLSYNYQHLEHVQSTFDDLHFQLSEGNFLQHPDENRNNKIPHQ